MSVYLQHCEPNSGGTNLGKKYLVWDQHDYDKNV